MVDRKFVSVEERVPQPGPDHVRLQPADQEAADHHEEQDRAAVELLTGGGWALTPARRGRGPGHSVARGVQLYTGAGTGAWLYPGPPPTPHSRRTRETDTEWRRHRDGGD